MERLKSLLQPRFAKAQKGKVLYDTAWYQNEDFFTKDTPKLEWKLVSKNLIPESTSKDYLDQTKVLRDYLKQHHLATPDELHECADDKLQKIRELMKKDWQQAALKLANLKINQNHRRAPVEALYDLLLRFGATGERLLKDKWDWTAVRSSAGNLVHVGHVDAAGADVSRWSPGLASGEPWCRFLPLVWTLAAWPLATWKFAPLEIAYQYIL